MSREDANREGGVAWRYGSLRVFASSDHPKRANPVASTGILSIFRTGAFFAFATPPNVPHVARYVLFSVSYVPESICLFRNRAFRMRPPPS